VSKPNNISILDWALYNQRSDRTLAELSEPHAPNLDGARCECRICETCQRRHAQARAAVNDALDAAIRGEKP
jgi:hypothetical protein